jgi:hypothetical protein
MATDVDLRVAATVRAEMARCRLPQVKVADALGISQAAVSRRLVGVVPFTVGELSTLADLLGLNLGLLVAEPAA